MIDTNWLLKLLSFLTHDPPGPWPGEIDNGGLVERDEFGLLGMRKEAQGRKKALVLGTDYRVINGEAWRIMR